MGRREVVNAKTVVKNDGWRWYHTAVVLVAVVAIVFIAAAFPHLALSSVAVKAMMTSGWSNAFLGWSGTALALAAIDGGYREYHSKRSHLEKLIKKIHQPRVVGESISPQDILFAYRLYKEIVTNDPENRILKSILCNAKGLVKLAVKKDLSLLTKLTSGSDAIFDERDVLSQLERYSGASDNWVYPETGSGGIYHSVSRW